MTGTRGHIDPTEFKPAKAGLKFFCFLIISIIVDLFLFGSLSQAELSTVGRGLFIVACVSGIILGITGGFIGSFIGKVIYESIGTIVVYEKSVMDIFIRKIGMKVGPGLIGCGIGTYIGAYLVIWIFR